jgi:hypothetical protein
MVSARLSPHDLVVAPELQPILRLQTSPQHAVTTCQKRWPLVKTPLNAAKGDTVEIRFKDRPEKTYVGYFNSYNPLRCAFWVTSKPSGKAGWLVEGDEFERILKKKVQKGRPR